MSLLIASSTCLPTHCSEGKQGLWILTVRSFDAHSPCIDADRSSMDSDGPFLDFDTAEGRGCL